MDRRLEGSGLKKIYSKVSAENADDLIFRNHALFELGQLYLEKCDFPNAVDCFEKVKTEALQFHLYDNYFRSITSLLRIHAERLDFDKHDSLIREVLQVGSSLDGYKRYFPKLQYIRGLSADYRKDREEALKYYLSAKSACDEVLQDASLSAKEKEDLVRDSFVIRYSLAVMEKDAKRYEEALAQTNALLAEISELTHGEKAQEYAQLYSVEVVILILQGHCYRHLKDYSKALDCYWKAHAVLRSNRAWIAYYYVLLGLGCTYLELGNEDRAKIFFDLVSDAVSDLELNALKKTLDRVSNSIVKGDQNILMIDRERKVIIESTLGEVHFERRFVLLEILYLLASQPGKVFTKEDLVDKIWRENYNPLIHDSKVYTSISRLRKLIEPDFRRPIYILNERDGYAFNPSVKLEEMGNRLRKGGAMVEGKKDPMPRLEGVDL